MIGRSLKRTDIAKDADIIDCIAIVHLSIATIVLKAPLIVVDTAEARSGLTSMLKIVSLNGY